LRTAYLPCLLFSCAIRESRSRIAERRISNPRDSRARGGDSPYASRSLVKSTTLRDASESTTFSLALRSPVPPSSPAVQKPALGSTSRGDDFQRNSRLTRHRPIEHQSAFVCRVAGDAGGNEHPTPSYPAAFSSARLAEKMAPDRSGL